MALGHDFHVRLNDSITESTEFLDVLCVDDLAVALIGDVVGVKHSRHGKERAEEGVALHPQLEIWTFRCLASDLESSKRDYANVLVDDLLAILARDPLPHCLGVFI